MLNRGVLVVRQYAKLARAVRVPSPSCAESPSTSADVQAQESAQREINLRGTVTPRRWHVAHEQQKTPRVLPLILLSKSRLSAMVVITALGGYAMAPVGGSMLALSCCAVGTGLMSASANTLNQLLEVPYDSQMMRTQSRVLVLGRLSPLHAALFAATASTAGACTLSLISPTAAMLGVLNVILYSGVYTPLKRRNITCTWVGAVVGAIPPLMGWATLAPLDGAAFTMAAMLFTWQFPHFNSLSWNLRQDYSRAGYRVMCVTDPALCTRTTLRYSLIQAALCSVAAPLAHLTAWSFAVDSLPLNIVLIYLSYRFYKDPNTKTSRQLFRYTLLYMPLLMSVMIVGKYARH